MDGSPAPIKEAADEEGAAAVEGGAQPPTPAPQPEGCEISVMNNYFGIGLDAKIAMDFGTFRDNNPEKCRNRIKNQMWYGVLGGKEMLAQTCKNLNERITLVCDGVPIRLPRLQGVVILNIGSYMGVRPTPIRPSTSACAHRRTAGH